MSPHPHRGRRGQARKQWEAAASAASLLYRAMDARTWTAGADLFNAAEAKLREAGLPDLAETVATVCNDFGCCTDDELRELQDRVAEEAGKLEATYLEMGL